MMVGIDLRGGKTAPRLFQDLLIYDPRKLPPSGFNILTDIPVFDEEQEAQEPPPPRVGKGSCRHQWSLKRNQCVLPENGYNADEQTCWILAAFCAVCRSHLELQLDFRGGGSFMKPCPTDTQPLHHFVYHPELSSPGHPGMNPVPKGDGFSWTDTHTFQCSSWECHAEMIIRFKPPRLTQDWVDLLTDRSVIKTRAERAISSDPERFEGFAVPPPIDVLMHSKHYITNPLFNPEKSRKIQGYNKRFLLSMGEPCADLLEYFGFIREGEDWSPPKPKPAETLPFTDQIRMRIDDVEKELSVLISQALDEKRRRTEPVWSPESAAKELRSVLGCLVYKKSIRSRTGDLTPNTEEHPFYAGLGAVEDFHDSLLIFAYEQQLAQDLSNTSYYLECLQGIAQGRKSEDLQFKVALEATSDKISRRDVRDAYKELGLDARGAHEDDTIIGIFNSRITDAPKQEPEMRRALKVIGQNRQSERIQVIASQAVTNYEQALSFLGASHDTADEFIPSMFTLRRDERPSDEPTARRAVVLIASHRNSQALKNFLNTGEMGDVEMDVDTAYARLDIIDRNVDDELVLAIYNSRVADDPSQTDGLRNALLAIAKTRNSRRINDFVNTGMISSNHSLSEWPVGLENIGNTCYLNSLLQFYFTIRPLRDLVLKIDDYKTPMDETSLGSKRVGSRNVSKKEVSRAQSFADELRKLFESMISSPKASVTPEPELARLTLLSSDKAEIFRRQSILSPIRPSLGEINGKTVLGPLGPPSSEAVGDMVVDDQKPRKGTEETAVLGHQCREGDSSSDDTLVDDIVAPDPDAVVLEDKKKEVQKKILEDKENLPPAKESAKESSPDIELTPLGQTSPSRINEQDGSQGPPKGNEDIAMDVTDNVQGSPMTVRDSDYDIPDLPRQPIDDIVPLPATTPPKRSPPLPPRPNQKISTTSNALMEAEVGAQQDVTEVIANFLFQLQCAIKPESIDESGEQIDRVKELFFGKQKSYTTDNMGVTRTKEEYMSDIKVDVATGPRDIYAALDGAYDVQDVEVGGGVEPQYTSISVLPPVLQVHVQRSLYDREKKAAFKSTNHLELKETIYMDRYMDSDDSEILERRRQCWRWKQELMQLEKRRDQLATSEDGMDMPAVLEALHGYLQRLESLNDPDPIEFSPTLVQDMKIAAQAAREELESLGTIIRDLRSNIVSQFNDLQAIPYRLQSVFVHRGYHNSGHYWIYIYDFTKMIWRKYNDGYVTEVTDTSEIFSQEPGDRPATPYFLVYIKDEVRDTLVDPVCREPVEAPLQERDTVMEDYGESIELPATEANSYRPVNASQDYEIGDSYQNISYDDDSAAWDNAYRKSSTTGW